MEYGVMYIKIVSGDEKLSWLQYCYIFGALPKQIQRGIKEITDRLNEKYKDDLVIPLTYSAQNGCVVNYKQVYRISNDLYYEYFDMLKDISDKLSVRLVYSIGEIDNINVKSIHEVDNDDVMVRIGQFLDKYNLPGITGV